MESFNRFSQWVGFGNRGVIADNDPVEREKTMKFNALIMIGCDPVSVESLRGLENLRSLTIQDSGIRNLSGICDIPLHKLKIPRNFIEDLTPLLDFARPCEIDVTGNPLSVHSYRELAPELSRRGHQIKVSGELPWKVTTRLHSHGVPVSCYHSSLGFRLCRPGLSLTRSPDYDHPVITTEQARSLLHEEPQKAYEYFEHDELVPRLIQRTCP